MRTVFFYLAYRHNTANDGYFFSIQQQAQAQLIQTPDGQTFIYQPVQVDNTQAIAQSQQTQPTRTYYRIDIQV